ncbi:MAG: hypothetical protein JWR52_2146 [Marmoricola sp.]|nr:hypothetical protein [Marmoricola sp.]
MGEHELDIHEFLLGFVLSAEVHGGSQGLSGSAEPQSVLDLRAEIERHHDLPRVVGSDQGTHGTSRCATCPDDQAHPCTALRLLAAVYARHPAYRAEWRPTPPPGSTRNSNEPRKLREPID